MFSAVLQVWTLSEITQNIPNEVSDLHLNVSDSYDLGVWFGESDTWFHRFHRVFPLWRVICGCGNLSLETKFSGRTLFLNRRSRQFFILHSSFNPTIFLRITVFPAPSALYSQRWNQCFLKETMPTRRQKGEGRGKEREKQDWEKMKEIGRFL